MGTNEEYLDQLLQSVTDEKKEVTAHEFIHTEEMTDEELLASLIDMYSEELAEFKTEEIIHKDETSESEIEVPASESYEMGNAEDVAVVDTQVEDTVVEEESNAGTILDEFFNNNAALENDGFGEQNDLADLLGSLQEEMSEIPADETESIEQTVEEVPQSSFDDNGIMSADSIAELFAAMEQKEDSVEIESIDSKEEEIAVSSDEDNLLKEMGIDTMSEEQIDDLLNAASASAEPAEQEMNLNDLFGGLNFADDFDPDSNRSEDVADLLGGMMSGDDDLAEINALLQKADSNEDVDSNIKNILNAEDDIGGNDLLNELLQTDADSDGKDPFGNPINRKIKKKKDKKAKKEKLPKEKKEKGAFWKKITDTLFEEDELDTKEVSIITSEDGTMMIDEGENEDILAELMNEDMMAKKKKKKDKDKKKATKGKEATSEDGEEGEVIDLKEQAKLQKKKQKAEKVAAKKKEKAEKAEADKAFLKAQPSISTKRAMVAFLFALSILGVVLIIYTYVPSSIEKGNARKAFYNKDYYEAYELLVGKELNDSDTILLDKVTCILKMQRKLDSYNNYIAMEKELEALNALMEGVRLYDECYTHANALSIGDEVNAIYNEIIIILNGKYGVSVDMAKEINAVETDEEYTLRLQYLLDGKTWGNVTDANQTVIEDVLPEEEDFLEGQ